MLVSYFRKQNTSQASSQICPVMGVKWDFRKQHLTTPTPLMTKSRWTLSIEIDVFIKEYYIENPYHTLMSRCTSYFVYFFDKVWNIHSSSSCFTSVFLTFLQLLCKNNCLLVLFSKALLTNFIISIWQKSFEFKTSRQALLQTFSACKL